MCPVKLANEMPGLSGTLGSSMTRCGDEATERSRGGAGDETTDDAPTKPILAQGSLGRVVVQIPSSLDDTCAQPNANRTWPESLAGFRVQIATISASMVSVNRFENSTPNLIRHRLHKS